MKFKSKFSGIRKRAGVMNQTEARWAWLLDVMKRHGEIEDYSYETMKFKVADGSWYCPDFMVVYKDYIAFHEIKGSYLLDKLGKSKFMQAVNEFPFYRWVMMSWHGKTKGWDTVYDNEEVGK